MPKIIGNIRSTAAPTEEPVTVAEVKVNSRIYNTVEDSLISSWIAAARLAAQNYTAKSLVTQSWKMVLDGWPNSLFKLPMSPLIGITSIKYYDDDNVEHLVDDSLYFVDTISEIGRVSLNLNESWPNDVTLRPISSVIVEFSAGYGAADDVPDVFKNAIYIYCTHQYENREGESEIPDAFFTLLRPERMVM